MKESKLALLKRFWFGSLVDLPNVVPMQLFHANSGYLRMQDVAEK
jgi:hypothetical protein